MRRLWPVLCAALLLLTGCVSGSWSTHSSEPRLADHEAIEEVLARANMGFELSDADMFADAFAPDAVYRLDE